MIRWHTKETLQWMLNGAQPTNTVKNIFSAVGLMMQKHLQMGVKRNKITQTVADQRLSEWQKLKKDKMPKFLLVEINLQQQSA